MKYEPLWNNARSKPYSVKQKWLVDFLMRNPLLRFGMGITGLLFEFGAIFACILGGSICLKLLLVVGSLFHVSTIPLMGIFFPYNIPCYAITLLPESAQTTECLFNIPTIFTGLLLGYSTY